MISSILVDAARAERAGHLDAALGVVEDARAGQGGVLAVVASRLLLAVRGPVPALAAAEQARETPAGAWSLRAAADLAVAAAHLRVHTVPALELAKAAVAAAEAILSGAPDDPDAIDAMTATEVSGAGDAGRFLCRGSLSSLALELRGLAAARGGEIRVALDAFAAAYAAGEGDPDRRARVLLAWGLQLRNWGLLDEALRRIERSLELRLQLEDLHGAAICQGVIAFVHQRRGDHARERDALVADLRLVERIGSTADVPGLRARLAGALVGVGKYAAAYAEAEAALAGASAGAGGEAGGRLERSESARGIPAPDRPPNNDTTTRTHAFAWREQARCRLGEGRLDDADALLDRAIATFGALGDPYAAGLCEITRAQVALARGDAAGALAARDRGAPVFARLGAIVEAAELALLAAEARGGDAAAANVLARVVPALVEAGLGDTPLAQRARELAARLSPGAVNADLVARAARLPALAARVLEE